MARVDQMLSQLPVLYRDGELLRQLLALPALQLEILAEDMLEVQRAHWFNSALDLTEAGGLADALDIAPEEWQTLSEFRIWVHALRNARLRDGAVTCRAIHNFVAEYTSQFRQAVGITTIWPEIRRLDSGDSCQEAILDENPLQMRMARIPATGGLEPLHQFTIIQRGLDNARASFLMVGLPGAPESVPCIVNVTTGEALLFMGNVPPGKRLWLRAAEDGSLNGHLEMQDVSAQLVTVTGIEPGVAWSAEQVTRPAQAMTLARGRNEFWFLPLAHYDALGLDRFLLALPDLLMSQGRYDGAIFDRALFFHEPVIKLHTIWSETQPAAFAVDLPGGLLLNRAGELTGAINQRERLTFSLQIAVGKLRAAGVESRVGFKPFCEQQGQRDYLTMALPLVHREGGPTGADSSPDAGGAFSVSEFGQSTFE